MQTDQAPPATNPAWFLIAFDGDMVLKLFDALDIGEGQYGELALNPTPDERLVRLEVADGELSLLVLTADLTLSEGDSISTQQLTFDESTTVRLNFPHTSLIITPDFVAGHRASVDREVNCVSASATSSTASSPTIASPHLAEHLEEPVTLDDSPAAVSDEQMDLDEPLPDDIIDLLNAASEDDGDLIAYYLSDIPDEVAPDTPALVEPGEITTDVESAISKLEDRAQPELSLDSEPVPFEPRRVTGITGVAIPVVPDQQPATPGIMSDARSRNTGATNNWSGTHAAESRVPSSGRRGARIVLLTALACAALLLPVFLSDSDTLPVRIEAPPPVSSELPVPVIEPTVEQQQTEPALIPEPDPVPIPDPEPEAPIDEVEAPAPIPEVGQSTLVELLLMEARTLYEVDSIVSPIQRNAVKVLTEILAIDPTNTEALRLMYLSATRLLDLAKIAHAAGEEYQARNLIEEVLGFHPEFEDAHALLRSWAEESAPATSGSLQPDQNEKRTSNPTDDASSL